MLKEGSSWSDGQIKSLLEKNESLTESLLEKEGEIHKMN